MASSPLPNYPFTPPPSQPSNNSSIPVFIGGGLWLSPWQTAVACIVVFFGFILLGAVACGTVACLRRYQSRNEQPRADQPQTYEDGGIMMVSTNSPPALGTSSVMLNTFVTLIYKGIKLSTGEGEDGRQEEQPSPIFDVSDQNSHDSIKIHLAGSTAIECIFCQHSYEVGDQVMQLPCGHIFHKDDGIILWMKKQGYCPICHACFPG